MRRDTRAPLPVIGWREWIGLPGFGIERIKAKIDTGARTSAIHALDIATFSDGGRPHVSFLLHPAQRQRRPEVACVAPVLDQRIVRSSNGTGELRFVIEVEIRIGGSSWPVEMSLTNRDAMTYRVLIGRQALGRRFLVDPGRSFLAGRGKDADASLR